MLLSRLVVLFVMIFGGLQADLFLRDNLKKALPGDYLVILANKTQTLMHISAKQDQLLTIEEIAIPEGRKAENISWKEWVAQGAPGNTSWVFYEIDLTTGEMARYYSYTKKNWFQIPDTDNFLSKLLNLKLTLINEKSRKKVGPKPFSGPDLRPLWQPRMIIEGKAMNGIQFDAWQTEWPRDNSELSGKTIEIYLPQQTDKYRAYFPYWLQINGTFGKAKVRITDSGKDLKSPKQMMKVL